MAFGLDGMLYLTTGDGTSDSDGWNSGQTLDDLLGSVLRIDVREPTAEQAVLAFRRTIRSSTLAGAQPRNLGLRPAQPLADELSTARPGNSGSATTARTCGRPPTWSARGENYGWSVYEGSHPFYLERQRGPTPIVPPTIEHSHAEFRSLTGGVVYHGDALPDLEGAYIYGDYSSGRIWGMKHDGDTAALASRAGRHQPDDRRLLRRPARRDARSPITAAASIG